MQTLKGKTAFITGAGKGLGKAMALALAAEGVNLLLLGRTDDSLKGLISEAQKTNPDITAKYAIADVSNYQQVKAAVQQLVPTGPVDILINNAGILATGSILDLAVEEWEKVIATNVLGTYYVVHEILPFMLAVKSGDILNVGSTAGLKGAANMSAYGASKAAVINLTESLMQEVRKSGIRVTTITPSTIATEMTLNAKFTDGNPERVLQPEDLAFLVVNNLKLPQRAFVKEVSLWSTNP